MKVLAVDGAASRLEILAVRLRHLGLATVVADCGRAALTGFLAEQPDLIVIGLDLPDLDPIELVRRLRALEGGGDWAPIILLTRPELEDKLASGLAAGADDFLFMPIGDAVLAAKIRAVQRLIQIRISLLAATRKLDFANRELRRLSTVDGLTGVANRRHFDATLEREWRRSLRRDSELSLIMADIDHFKQFNDTLGHQAGDDCLCRVAATLAASSGRGGDLVARYGGEEFAVILPDTGLAGAVQLAELLRERVAAAGIRHPATALGRVSMSFGVAAAVATPETLSASLLRTADSALYRAKHDGRDRVAVAAPASGEDATDA